MNERRDDLQEIIDKALEEMAAEAGEGLGIDTPGLAEFCRRTGLTRSRARTTGKHGFRALPHGNSGRKAGATVPAGHTGLVDDQPGRGAANSQVIYERLLGQGYRGGPVSARTHMAAHRDLVPAPRRHVAPQGGRSQRFRTGPGEAYQTGWGFASVENREGSERGIACFAMVCHHCGTFYVEFFPNARQENLIIGMPRAFMAMGVPDEVPADDMKSVAARRDADGHPVWQRDYASLVELVGLGTRPREPRHPLAKGKAGRPVRFARGNFLAGMAFADTARPDEEALLWCARQAGRWRRAVACVPADEHDAACGPATRALEAADEVAAWLCPRRKTAFDGFVSYEGRRFGVPYWYDRRECRAGREGSYPRIHGDDLSLELAVHAVTWGRGDSWCEGQWAGDGPCELPSQRPTATIAQVEPPTEKPAFAKFDFGRWA